MAATVVGDKLVNMAVGPIYRRAAARRTRQFLEQLPATDLLVNVGCGLRRIPRWVNVDRSYGPGVDVVWDIRHGIPLPAMSCQAILIEHLIEHLDRDGALALLADCLRVLKSGGTLRISTPDAERYLRAYVEEDDEFFAQRALRVGLTKMDHINHMAREDGQHLWVYDFETLSLLLRIAGFDRVERMEPNVSAHLALQGVDDPNRHWESLYVEATR